MRVAAGELWAGTPAKIMRAMSEAERTQVPYLVEHYKDLARMHAALSVAVES
jgi:carbonic anhydrase/acetyltransferase-like protein (isoleucine patch superfamily)